MSLLCSACETTRYVTTAAPLKRAVKPICVDKDDKFTEGTAQAIEADNLAMRSLNRSHDECPKEQQPAK